MAQWARQFPGSFAAGARFIWTRVQSEWAAWRASIHRIDDAQLLPAIRFDRVHLAHARSRFERTIDISNAPFGSIPIWPPTAAYIANANRRSIPSMLFVIGSCRFDRTVRLDHMDLYIGATIALRAYEGTPRAIVSAASVPIPPIVPGPFVSPSAYPAGWSVTLDVRIHRVGEPAFAEAADSNFPQTQAPGLGPDPAGGGYIGTFMTPNMTRFGRAPVVGGPIRVSTYPHEAPDPNALPGRANRIPLLAGEVGPNDLVLVMMRTPRFYRTHNSFFAAWQGDYPIIQNALPSVATQSVSLLEAMVTIHAAAEATA